MQAAVDALIVGAGPAGSAAAIVLARAGWSVALVESQVFPRRKVCGECIAASNLPLLEALGVGSALGAAGPELRTVVLMQGARSQAAPLPAAAHARHRWGRALGRATLDQALLERAGHSGVAIWQPWSLQQLDGGPGQWRCTLRSPAAAGERTLRAGVLIDARGSAVQRTVAGAAAPRRGPGDLFAFKANYRGAALAPGQLPVLCLDGGYGGMVVADGGLMTIACCLRRDRLALLRVQAPGQRAAEVVEAWLRQQCAGVRLALQGAVRAGPWLASGPLQIGVRVDDDDGLLRVGNAAGEVHPILGEGISMALQSGVLLALQLRAARAAHWPAGADLRAWQQAPARRYAELWRQQFAGRQRLAAVFAHLAMRPAGAAALCALARRWPALLALGAQWGGKTRCAVDPAVLAA